MNSDQSTESRGERPRVEYILFDGTCALCHGFVTFVLKRDRGPYPFHFAPLQGDFVKNTLSEEIRRGLPDSVVLLDAQEQIHTESDAVICVLRRLGGGWGLVAAILSLVPRALRDFGYRTVARVRRKIFGAKSELCPIVPADLRGRFKG